MLGQESSSKEEVDLNLLADLVGFPKEMLLQELFSEEKDVESVDLAKLRQVVLEYIDATMLESASQVEQ